MTSIEELARIVQRHPATLKVWAASGLIKIHKTSAGEVADMESVLAVASTRRRGAKKRLGKCDCGRPAIAHDLCRACYDAKRAPERKRRKLERKAHNA